MEYDRRLKALGLYSVERLSERGDLIHAFKNVKGLVEIRGYRGALFQITGNTPLEGNGKTIVQKHVKTGLMNRLFAVPVESSWNKPSEVVVGVGSVRDCKDTKQRIATCVW